MTKFSILSLALFLINSSNSVDAAVNKNVKKISPIFKSVQEKQPQTPRYRRKLEDAEDAEEEEEEEELSFISGYNMLYQNCFVESRTISFKLCPRDDNHRECDQEDCEDGGEYVVDMETFLDAFTEAQMEAQNYRCEMARENCDEVDDDAAVADCYVEQGGFQSYEEYTNSCKENENGNDDEEDFDLQDYLACKQLDDDYYIGPSCADSVNLYLGLFKDEDCLYPAYHTPEDLGYDNIQYTATSGTPIISNECASCQEHRNEQEQNGGNDEEDENATIDQCEQLYQNAQYKCETSYMTSNYHTADSGDCEAISELKAAEQDFQERGGVRQASGFTIFLFTVMAIAALGGAIAFFKYSVKKKETEKTQESFNNTKQEGLIA